MFKKVMEYANKKEMRESRDEIVYGEIIAAMARRGFPAVSFHTGSTEDTGYQTAVFLTPADPVLHTVQVTLDRKTGGGAISERVVGSKATLRMVAEVKNFLADPDDLLAMWRTDFANITKMPMLGQTKIDHRLNSVIATKQVVIELSDFDGPEDRTRIESVLDGLYQELRAAISQYKRPSPLDQDI